MDQAPTSPIALVEAAYNLEAGPSEWLPNLLRAGGSILDLGQGCTAAIWAGTSSEGEPVVSQSHAENGPPDLAMRFARAAQDVKPDFARATPAPRKLGVHTLAETRCTHPEVHEALSKHVGCKDMLALWAVDPDLHGVVIQIPSTKMIELSDNDRKRWHMLSVHIAAGHRLRRKLGQTPEGKSVTPLPLEAIRAAATQADSARSGLGKSESCKALRLWEGVLRGQWSIIDGFDTNGRRFVLALPNSPHIRDPRGLTKREYQVATHAAVGASSKLIAYNLGISRPWVSQLLHGAMRKLGVQTKGQLVLKMRTVLVGSASSM